MIRMERSDKEMVAATHEREKEQEKVKENKED
jgi:hypothetical protein